MVRTGMNSIGTVEPPVVAVNVVDAFRRNRSYVFTDDHSTSDAESTLSAILQARADVCSDT
jgi:hypothetical protein